MDCECNLREGVIYIKLYCSRSYLPTPKRFPTKRLSTPIPSVSIWGLETWDSGHKKEDISPGTPLLGLYEGSWDLKSRTEGRVFPPHLADPGFRLGLDSRVRFSHKPHSTFPLSLRLGSKCRPREAHSRDSESWDSHMSPFIRRVSSTGSGIREGRRGDTCNRRYIEIRSSTTTAGSSSFFRPFLSLHGPTT